MRGDRGIKLVTQELSVLLKRHGWSKYRLARELGVSWNTVRSWELGRFKATAVSVQKIQELLGGATNEES